MNPVSTKVARRQLFLARQLLQNDSRTGDKGEMQQHLISSVFSNTNQSAEADFINSWRTRNATVNKVLVVFGISVAGIRSTEDISLL